MFSAIRDAVVGFVRAPRLFVTVVLTMGLVMGGLGAVGNLLYSVVFRPLNVPEPARLAAFYTGIGEGLMGIAPATLAELNRTQRVFEGLCGIERGTFTVELNGALSRHLWEGVQGTCAQIIGIRPSLGRLIGPEDAPSADSPAPVVVLSHRYWQRSFASNPAVLAFALSFPTAEVRHVEALPPAFRRETDAPGSEVTAASDWVSPGFFEASGMSLIRGRDFGWQDVAGQPDVAIVTAKMAQLLFADTDPLGERVRMPNGKMVTVVGIAGDATSGDPRIAGFPRIYLPLLQEPRRLAGANLILRQDQPVSIRAELDATIAALGWQSITFMRTANEQTDLLLARERLLAKLSLFFGALALAVVTLGLFALLSYSVAQRRREIGVRSALGATRTRILALIVGEGVVITGVGIVAGLPLAAWVRHASDALLFQAPTVDSVAILITIGIVALASTIASAAPARTAANLEPSEALRHP